MLIVADGPWMVSPGLGLERTPLKLSCNSETPSEVVEIGIGAIVCPAAKVSTVETGV